MACCACPVASQVEAEPGPTDGTTEPLTRTSLLRTPHRPATWQRHGTRILHRHVTIRQASIPEAAKPIPRAPVLAADRKRRPAVLHGLPSILHLKSPSV